MAPLLTKPSTPKLSDLARRVVAPEGAVSTAWPSVERKCREFGVQFRKWQPGVGRLILSKRADGKYASTIGGTGMSIPRQVGKTFLVGAIVFALCLLYPNLTVIWTAHRLRTAEETFGKMQVFAKRRKIKPYIRQVFTGSGDEEIRFLNGSRILFGARERGFGRGFDEVDVLIFDEAQILSENALDDMIPATNQSRQPSGALLLFMGTPPKPSDPGDVFRRMRTDALAGEDPDTAWIEFGADPDYIPTPLPAQLTAADWAQVEKANPSYPEDTPREAILRMRKKLGPDSYLREGLGIWDDATLSVFGVGNWNACRGPIPEGVPVGALAIASTIDLTHAAITAAAVEGDVVHVKPLQHGPGTGWVVARAKELQDKFNVDVVIDGRGPARVLIPHLDAAGVRLLVRTTEEVLDACASVMDLVKVGHLKHDSYPELDRAVAGAARRPVGDRWAWGRKTSSSDISTLEAATLAAHHVNLPEVEKPSSEPSMELVDL
jgi:hypothetical protein